MASYYSVGYREPCGHHHRTLSGARRCARAFLNANRADMVIEAHAHGLGIRAYIREIVNGSDGDSLIARITA